MKYFLIGEVVDTKKSTISGIETILQKRLDNWLGKDKAQIKVDALNSNTMKFTLYRTYGDWYDDPQMFQPNHDVFSWDKIILLGDDYQTGTTADFDTLTGRYVISYAEDDFFRDYKGKARENHCTRIKHLEQQSFLDRIEFTVELVSRTAKKNNP
jgi:hypothetical protein